MQITLIFDGKNTFSLIKISFSSGLIISVIDEEGTITFISEKTSMLSDNLVTLNFNIPSISSALGIILPNKSIALFLL